jgi:2-polyprenyl-3-methyl-5-hydroxy-6-metoxy-1,4-benzoquinol methylase
LFSFRERKLNINEKWLNSLKKDISETYIKYNEPWKQAGFLLGQKEWEICRRPLAECIDKAGTFLDIGCSNGYLLENILKWTSHSITPFGIDLSQKLIELAKARLPQYSSNFFVGSATDWTSPITFDYIRIELESVLSDSQEQFLHKLLNSYLAPDGKLLLTEYRSKKDSAKKPWLNEKVESWGFNIVDQKSAFIENTELTRVLVLTRKISL